MVTENYYKVAGHTFRLSFSDELPLYNYLPFTAKETGDCLFHLSVTDTLNSRLRYEEVGRFDDDIASIGIAKSGNGAYRFRIAHPGSSHYCTMDVNSSFREAQAKLPDNKKCRYFCLNNCLMLLYAFATAPLDTVLMHASVIKNNNNGYLFLGKSGTGKSTHSSLWLEHIPGSELLNDDNPVVRIVDGQPYVFGSPWSGKTPCYKKDCAPLKGIVKLRQAPGNKITKQSLLQAYATVVPSCSCMRWENELMTGVHHTVEQLATKAGCYQLDCLPDKAAAELCHTTLSR